MSNVTLEQASNLIEEWVRHPEETTRCVVATGFHGLWEAHKDPEFQRVLNSADLFCADGIAPVWLSRLGNRALSERVPGPDLLLAFLARANVAGYSSFFLGDTDETLAALRDKVRSAYPGHRIAGMLSPPFRTLTVEENQSIINQINSARPDVLWVGLGLCKQSWWIHQHRNQLHVAVAAGVGAAFGFISGRVKRAPRWIGDHGFEWLWRLGAEPLKLWHRDLVEGPRFLAYALRECLRTNPQRSNSLPTNWPPPYGNSDAPIFKNRNDTVRPFSQGIYRRRIARRPLDGPEPPSSDKSRTQ